MEILCTRYEVLHTMKQHDETDIFVPDCITFGQDKDTIILPDSYQTPSVLLNLTDKYFVHAQMMYFMVHTV